MVRSGRAASTAVAAMAPLLPLHALANAPQHVVGQPDAPPPAIGAERGVVSYPASTFATARPTTAYDMIQRLPGFTFDGGAQVRGFAGAAGDVLIDGERPTTKQDDLASALRRVPASDVERIDVIHGGAPGIDMQGRTVMANVVLKHGGGGKTVVTVWNKTVTDDGRNLQGMQLEWSKREADRTFEAAYSGGGYVDDGSGAGPHTVHDGTGAQTYSAHLWTKAADRQSIFTSAYERPLGGGKIRVSGLIQLDNYLDREIDQSPAPPDEDTYKEADNTLKSELGLHYVRDFGAKATLESLAIQQLSRLHEQSRYIAPDDDERFDLATITAESIGRATLRYRPHPSLALEAALEGAYNTLGARTRFLVNAVPQSLPAANEHVAETRGEAALSVTWTLSPRYTLEAGLRLEGSTVRASGDVNQSKSLFYPKPRLVFTWSPMPKDQVRLRAEREVGQLDFAAFSASGSLNAGGLHAGNPNLLPQQAWVLEAAVEHRFWKTGDATVTLRHSDISDAVDRIVGFDPITGPYDEGGNLGHATENDLVVDITLPLSRLGLKNAQLKATGTWRDTQVEDPVTRAPRPLTQTHPLDLDVHFTQDLTRIRSSWGVDFTNGWTETYYRFDEIDTYRYGRRVNLFFEYKPTPGLSLRAEANDLFSGGFQRQIASFAGPRNAYPGPYSLDLRKQQIGPLIILKIRRAFGYDKGAAPAT